MQRRLEIEFCHMDCGLLCFLFRPMHRDWQLHQKLRWPVSRMAAAVGSRPLTVLPHKVWLHCGTGELLTLGGVCSVPGVACAFSIVYSFIAAAETNGLIVLGCVYCCFVRVFSGLLVVCEVSSVLFGPWLGFWFIALVDGLAIASGSPLSLMAWPQQQQLRSKTAKL